MCMWEELVYSTHGGWALFTYISELRDSISLDRHVLLLQLLLDLSHTLGDVLVLKIKQDASECIS